MLGYERLKVEKNNRGQGQSRLNKGHTIVPKKNINPIVNTYNECGKHMNSTVYSAIIKNHSILTVYSVHCTLLGSTSLIALLF